MADLREEINRRRTFAIISHPDAGKTTLTEKLLLYGGAINLAGSVKGKKTAKHAVSDWMEIEKQRGISVTSSVLQFNYDGFCINILDTPGHQDFSEDTYRTLMAADSAVMVIDASKGVENQTKKLFKVCVMRHIPIITFINKMDRDAQSPFDLLEDIENVLGINTCPMNWPIGSGKEFKGVYDRESKAVLAFTANNGQKEVEEEIIPIDDSRLDELLEDKKQDLIDDIELLDGAGDEFDLDAVRAGTLTPVFFGSALTNFGVEPFLEQFLKLTPPPLARETVDGIVDTDSDFSAFVFKIQANMNKAHRDRIAFMRICGVFDPGIFMIGDTVCTAKNKVRYKGIPTFAPEHFCLVRQKDTMKRKQFIKGISQIAQEGAIQIFQELDAGMEEVIVGVVGVLQFDVLKYRLENEYNVEIIMENLPFEYIRWIENEDIDPKELDLASDTKRIQDLKGNKLLLFTSFWSIDWALDHNKELRLQEFGNA